MKAVLVRRKHLQYTETGALYRSEMLFGCLFYTTLNTTHEKCDYKSISGKTCISVKAITFSSFPALQIKRYNLNKNTVRQYNLIARGSG